METNVRSYTICVLLYFRRTGRDIKAGKNIRIREDGFENFDDYLSESGMFGDMCHRLSNYSI